jgi:hypothetical protein
MPSPLDHRPAKQRLGDFEIVREAGRGGMGVVYEARQVSLNLSGSFIELDGVRALAASPHQACLTFLRVGGYGFLAGYPNSLVDAAEILLSSAHLPGLTRLDLGYPTYGEPDPNIKETLRQKFANRVVRGDGQPGLHVIDR